MKKIKFQGTLTKFLTSRIALYHKSKFANYIATNNNLSAIYKIIKSNYTINVDVVSFSSNSDFNEQVLSILSFVKYIGIPSSWTLYSDGSHREDQVKHLELSFPFLKLIKIDLDSSYIRKNIKKVLSPYQDALINYASMFPLGKRLFLYLNFPINKPVIFLDSDILFYSKASGLAELVNDNNSGWFLPDAEWGNLDSRYIARNKPQHYQVNGGLLLINQELSNFSKALDFLKEIEGNYEYFSEQTVMHILLLENNFMPLDPRIFALNSGDQFDFGYLYSKDSIAIRHYTGPVRHKMWQRNWKWHLSTI